MISPRAQLIVTLFISQSLRIISMLVMARMIGKADFGLFTMVTTLSAFFFVGFGDFSIPSTIVQSRDVPEKTAVDTSMVLCSLLYLFYGAITVAAGYYLSVVHEDPRMIWVALMIAAVSFLGEIYSIQLARLNRSMRFRAEAFQNIVFALCQAVTGIGLALSGWGIYAIAIQQLAGQLIANIVICRHAPIAWPTDFSMAVARRFLTIGGKISLALYVTNLFSSAVTLSFNNIGNRLGGPERGLELVGVWDRTTKIYSLFTQNVLSAFDRVFFTSICAATETHRKKLVVDAMGIYGLVSCGLGVLLYVAAPDMVKVVMGSKWNEVIPLLQVLALSVPSAALYGVGYASSYSIGRTGILFLVQIGVLVLFGSALLTVQDDKMWPTWLYASSRYFIGLTLVFSVLTMMKIDLIKSFSSTFVSVIQALLVMGYVHYSMNAFSQASKWVAGHFPANIMGHSLPTENIFSILILSFAVFVMYLMLTMILQPAMGRRLLQLTARNKTNPATTGGANDLSCSVN